MAQPERPPPLPPDDLATRELPIEIVAAGSTFVRIHHIGVAPLHFGASGDNRFDAPDAKYGVCYVAHALEGAFAETCLRAVGVQFVARSFLEQRAAAVITTTAGLRLVRAHGSGLARIGATGAVSSGAYAAAQAWSQAFHRHPSAPDGITYRSNHDNGEICAALFDRCRAHIQVRESMPLLSDPRRLAALLDRYDVGLG